MATDTDTAAVGGALLPVRSVPSLALLAIPGVVVPVPAAVASTSAGPGGGDAVHPVWAAIDAYFAKQPLPAQARGRLQVLGMRLGRRALPPSVDELQRLGLSVDALVADNGCALDAGALKAAGTLTTVADLQRLGVQLADLVPPRAASAARRARLNVARAAELFGQAAVRELLKQPGFMQGDAAVAAAAARLAPEDFAALGMTFDGLLGRSAARLALFQAEGVAAQLASAPPARWAQLAGLGARHLAALGLGRSAAQVAASGVGWSERETQEAFFGAVAAAARMHSAGDR